MDQTWHDAGSLDDLPPGGARLVRAGDRQVALFRLGPSTLHAVDNLCPHEGYPLVQGSVKGCVLTCAWHNFKFDLRDGRCVLGDEDVAAHEVRVQDGRIAVRLRDDASASARAARLSSLRRGWHERAPGRMARDVARLLHAGMPAQDLLLEAARLDAEHAEHGTTHALPLATDLLRWLPRCPGLKATLPILHALDVAAEPSGRLPARPVPEPRDPGDLATLGERLRELVESEELATAEALLRGALARGAAAGSVLGWLLRLCSDHFLDFGHALIYATKLGELADALGWERVQELAPALLYAIGTGTREDVLPPMRPVTARLAELRHRLPVWQQQREPLPRRAALVAAILDAGRDEAQDAVVAALDAGAAPAAIVDALSLAAAERGLRFAAALDRDPTVQHDWLDVTHLLTFARAVRCALTHTADPAALRLLLFAAHFIQRSRPLDGAPSHAATAPVARAEVAEVLGALDAHDLERAPGLAAACWARSPDALRQALEDRVLRGHAVRPIVVAHSVKTLVAAFDEAAHLGDPAPVRALARFLAADLRESRLERLAHEAVRFVGERKPPRRLIS